MRKTMSSILAVVLCIFMLGTGLYVSVASSLTEESIKANIKNNLLSGFIYDDDGNKTEIFKKILELTTLDEETVIKLMENEKVDEILTDIVNSIYDYNLTGDESYKYSGEELRDIVDNNMDEILSEICYEISAKDREEVIIYMTKNEDYIVSSIYGTDIGDYTR